MLVIISFAVMLFVPAKTHAEEGQRVKRPLLGQRLVGNELILPTLFFCLSHKPRNEKLIWVLLDQDPRRIQPGRLHQ